MTMFRVWAPRADRVHVDLPSGRVAMHARAGDWYSVNVPEAIAGTDYAFVLDDGEPLPDPRSPWQPRGVHGPSRTVDHDAFAWTDEGWCAPPLASAVLYELHVGTFTPDGTFDAAIDRLDHLVDLGITHVELMPVAQFPGERGWGYDGVDLYAPHHSYGGPDGLKRLIDACHARGLAVLLDVVYNHLGPSGNYLAKFGPYFTDRYHTPWGDAVNFDGRGSDEVRRFFCDNALMWLRDYHFDGLRIDAVHAIIDTSAIHFLEQLASEVEALEAALGRHLVLVAESDLNDPRIVRPTAVSGYGLDAQWNEDFHHALHAALTGEHQGYYADFGSLADLGAALERGFVYDGRYSAYRGRRHGRPVDDLPGHCFVGCLQNHDQVGNRAKGDRIAHVVDDDLAKIGAALVMTSPFLPLLFQGEEWGASTPFQYFTDHQEAELAEAVREGRREEFSAFGWAPEEIPDPQDHETFERSKLRWQEVAEETHAELLEWYRSLIELRRATPALTDGDLEEVRVRCDEDSRWLVVTRRSIVLAANLDDRVHQIEVEGAASGSISISLSSSPEVELLPDGVKLPPRTAAILQRA
jgi:maltooligosyltrehalose trehalohydrolase